jgi:hypothetical protein
MSVNQVWVLQRQERLASKLANPGEGGLPPGVVK